jgi:hypothetical protein
MHVLAMDSMAPLFFSKAGRPVAASGVVISFVTA